MSGGALKLRDGDILRAGEAQDIRPDESENVDVLVLQIATNVCEFLLHGVPLSSLLP
jgi:hypothetical protein